MSSSKTKIKIDFPNRWALDSFLLKLEGFPDLEVRGHSDNTHYEAKPKGSAEAILIGLNKAGGAGTITMEINAEKIAHGVDEFWKEVDVYANRYRC